MYIVFRFIDLDSSILITNIIVNILLTSTLLYISYFSPLPPSPIPQECHINQLQLNSSEVAAQLTLRDFHLFHDVEPTEYVDELFELDSKYGHPHLDEFSQVQWGLE